MKTLIKNFFSIFFILHMMTNYIPSINFTKPEGVLYTTVVLTILFTLITPILNIFLLPLHLLTLNISQWFLYIFIFYLSSRFNPYVSLTSWNFTGVNIGLISISPLFIPYWGSAIILAMIFVISFKFLRWVYE